MPIKQTILLKIYIVFTILKVLCINSQSYYQSSSYSNNYNTKYYSPLQFNLKQCSYQINSQWTKVRFGVQGGSIPYTYYFDEYPQGWKYVKQDLFIPKQNLTKTMKFPCKVRISDKNGSQTKATIIILISKNKATVSQNLYPYDKIFQNNFYNSGQYNGIPKLIKSNSYVNIDSKTDDNEMSKFNNYYLSDDQLKDYQDRVDRLKSCDVSKVGGTGFNVFFNDNNNGYGYSAGYTNNYNNKDNNNNGYTNGYTNTNTNTNNNNNNGYNSNAKSNSIFNIVDALTAIKNTNNVNNNNIFGFPTTFNVYTNNTNTNTNNKDNNNNKDNSSNSNTFSQFLINTIKNASSSSNNKTTTTTTNSNTNTNINSNTNTNSNINKINNNLNGFFDTIFNSNTNNINTNGGSTKISLTQFITNLTNSLNNININTNNNNNNVNININTNTNNNTNNNNNNNNGGNNNFSIILNNNTNNSNNGGVTIIQNNNNTSTSTTTTTSTTSSTSSTLKSDIDLYTFLPNAQQIDTLILNSDLLALIKLVQQVVTTSLSCQQKYSYLISYLSRIQSAIAMKQFTAQQLQIIIDGATQTYNNISKQIIDTKNQISNLNITALKDKLNNDLTLLSSQYTDFNTQDSNTTQLNTIIQKLNKDISIQQAKSDIQRQQLIRQKLSYNDADQNVKNIQTFLNAAKLKKSQIQTNITNYNKRITDSQSQIDDKQKLITQLQSQIKSQQQLTDNLKSNYSILQVNVQRYRSDINNKTKYQDNYTSQNYILQDRINIENKKLMTQQYNKLKQMITSLTKALPGVQSFIDSGYYTCIKISDITMSLTKTNVNNTNNSITSIVSYNIGITQYQNYIQTSYILKPDWNKITLPKSITLNAYNIMDLSWQASYGYPYSLASYATSTDFSFNNDFNCLTPSSLQSGMGTIVSIVSRVIIIMADSGQVKLNLGACTRVQANLNLPNIGARIFWRGVPYGNNYAEFNVYKVSCV